MTQYKFYNVRPLFSSRVSRTTKQKQNFRKTSSNNRSRRRDGDPRHRDVDLDDGARLHRLDLDIWPPEQRRFKNSDRFSVQQRRFASPAQVRAFARKMFGRRQFRERSHPHSIWADSAAGRSAIIGRLYRRRSVGRKFFRARSLLFLLTGPHFVKAALKLKYK